MRASKLCVATGAALMVLSTGAFLASPASAAAPRRAQAQPQPANPHPTHLVGQVKAVGAGSITLTTRSGDVTANVSPNTWIVVRTADGPGQGTLADLKVNEPATVAGMTTNDPKVVDARVVTQGVRDGRHAPGGQRGPGKSQLGGGTIKSISGSTLTITSNRGFDVQVDTTADTVVLDSGFKTVSALKVGDRVQVLGVPQRVNRNAPPRRDNVKVNAWAVRVVREGLELRVGQVASLSGNTLTLDPRRQADNLTINLSATTQYRKLTVSPGQRPTLSNASQADVKAGSRLVVEGSRSADGKALNATSVIIAPDKADLAPQV